MIQMFSSLFVKQGEAAVQGNRRIQRAGRKGHMRAAAFLLAMGIALGGLGGETALALTAEAQPDMSTPVYFNPDGGSYFHGDPQCSTVNKKYRPLAAITLADILSPPYASLDPCKRCAASFAAILEVMEKQNLMKPVTLPMPTAGTQFTDAPLLSAECAVLYDLTNSRILYEKNAAQRCEPASLTKLLTVLTAYANDGTAIEYTVGDEIEMIGSNSSTAYLREKNVLSFHSLVDAVMLASGNDAAYTLAVNLAREAEGNKQLQNEAALASFAGLMNDAAKTLGCTDSHFVSVDGYPSPEHYTTAYDMLRIAITAANTPLTAKSAARTRAYHVFISGREAIWETTNLLLKSDSEYYYPYATGLKTGSTGEGFSLAASAEKEGVRLIAILINANGEAERFREAAALFEYGFR